MTFAWKSMQIHAFWLTKLNKNVLTLILVSFVEAISARNSILHVKRVLRGGKVDFGSKMMKNSKMEEKKFDFFSRNFSTFFDFFFDFFSTQNTSRGIFARAHIFAGHICAGTHFLTGPATRAHFLVLIYIQIYVTVYVCMYVWCPSSFKDDSVRWSG